MRLATRHLLGTGGPTAEALQPPAPASEANSRSATPQPGPAPPVAMARSSSRAPSVPPPGPAEQAAFDIALEASKLPLHIALTECLAAATTEDRIKKLLTGGLVVVGGVANTHHTGFAIQSRLALQLASRYPNLAAHIHVVELPVELGRGEVVWKGASLLGKVEAVHDLFVRASEWDVLGLRALKERSPQLSLL